MLHIFKGGKTQLYGKTCTHYRVFLGVREELRQWAAMLAIKGYIVYPYFVARTDSRTRY